PGAAGHDRNPPLSRVGQYLLDVHRRARLHRRLRGVLAAAALVPRIRIDGRRLQPERGQLLCERVHPNTSTALPVIANGASVQRNLTTRATSSARTLGWNGVCSSIRVATPPGRTAAQKMPRSRPSSASDLMSPVRPHLLAL